MPVMGLQWPRLWVKDNGAFLNDLFLGESVSSLQVKCEKKEHVKFSACESAVLSVTSKSHIILCLL